jgi:hypothetical protein
MEGGFLAYPGLEVLGYAPVPLTGRKDKWRENIHVAVAYAESNPPP